MMPLLALNPSEQPRHSSQCHALPEVYVQNVSLEIAWSRLVFNGRTIAGNVLMPFFTQGYKGVDVNQPYDCRLTEEMARGDQGALTPISVAPYDEGR